ncbi:hypothetical protein [Ruminococcus flavefaciens]|uniref:hypothetical protein n=1 Tax=Ruminococcus flavefaciens TaxID=1265 RepID=UPI0026ECD4F3|nr:hypothetical protein [Ruminococcus flavefaciens]MDD7515922.1 hypothetical protein [Ruminococcus flavefaciens]MDY5691439.1 hypothetical protein [Ruminococcus flavefaciens]
MRNKKILSAIAAVSVLSLATGVTVFAATASPEAKTTEEAVVEETTAAAEETVEETSAEAENAEEETTAAEEAAEEVKLPPVAVDKPVGHVDLDVTDFFNEIKDLIDVHKYDVITDTLKENWDKIEKVKVHVDFEKPAKDEAEKPEPPVAPAELEDGEKPEPPAPPVAPAELEDGEKPEPPAPPVAPEDGEKPEPPVPPVGPKDGEKPEPPMPPHLRHEAEKAAAEAAAETAETETTTDAEISE